MLRSLHSAATGMEAQQTYIDITSNNLANVNTAGFKKSRANFTDLIYQLQQAPGVATTQATEAPSGIQVGIGVRTASTQKEFAIGSLKATNNLLDVAINGDGFFQIQMPNGTIGYTRDGAFHVDKNGNLVTPAGFPLEPNIVVPNEAIAVHIGDDGSVSAMLTAQAEAVQLGQIQTATFVNPAGLVNIGGNIAQETSASGPAVVGIAGENGFGPLQAGFLELSNVEVVEEMVNLITAQRAFEFNSKAVQASDQMLRELAQLR
jgi:flagellar basal-body rod protein FlgG